MFVVLFSEISHPFAEHPEQGHDAPVSGSGPLLGGDAVDHVTPSLQDGRGEPGPAFPDHRNQ